MRVIEKDGRVIERLAGKDNGGLREESEGVAKREI